VENVERCFAGSACRSHQLTMLFVKKWTNINWKIQRTQK
jgi:hypothetical protein